MTSRRRTIYACFFFFSSRRRHTRYWRDWSSDVCSSDLDPALLWLLTQQNSAKGFSRLLDRLGGRPLRSLGYRCPDASTRSEERRVGKECRSRWSPYH